MGKKPSAVGQIASAALRGAASGSGIASAPFKAANAAISGVKSIKQGFANYRKKTEQPVKPVKPYRKIVK